MRIYLFIYSFWSSYTGIVVWEWIDNTADDVRVADDDAPPLPIRVGNGWAQY